MAKRVRITFEAELRNPNHSSIYDPTDDQLREQFTWILEDNRENLLWLDTENKNGLFQRDWVPAESITANIEIYDE